MSDDESQMIPSIGEVEATYQNLESILKDIRLGKLALPTFQRGNRFGNPGLCWSVPQRRKLMASVLAGYPIGSITIVRRRALKNPAECGELRPISGTAKIDQDGADLLLDGQQRLSTLGQHLRLPVRGRPPSGDDARIFVFNWRRLIENLENPKNISDDLSPADQLYPLVGLVNVDQLAKVGGLFSKHLPLRVLFYDDEKWQQQISQLLKRHPESGAKFERFFSKIRERLKKYQIPISRICGGNLNYETVCDQFIKLNYSGKRLTTPDLVNARLAMEGGNLFKTFKQLFYNGDGDDILKGMPVGTKLSLLLTAGIGRDDDELQQVLDGNSVAEDGGRESLLRANREDFARGKDRLIQVIEEFEGILNEDEWTKIHTLPPECVLPALVVMALREQAGMSCDGFVRQRIRGWIWTSMIIYKSERAHGGFWGRKVAEVFDILKMGASEFSRWSKGQIEKSGVSPKAFQYQGKGGAQATEALLRMQAHGLPDFLDGSSAAERGERQVHHIFPKAWCEDRDASETIPRELWNSWPNLTLITGDTNRKIGGKAPSAYIDVDVSKCWQGDRTQFLQMFEKHGIPMKHLEVDDFESFYKFREVWLCRQFNDHFEKRLGLPKPFPETAVG